jgi:hypothetical protein
MRCESLSPSLCMSCLESAHPITNKVRGVNKVLVDNIEEQDVRSFANDNFVLYMLDCIIFHC